MKRLLALFLSIVMVVGSLPIATMTVFAEENYEYAVEESFVEEVKVEKAYGAADIPVEITDLEWSWSIVPEFTLSIDNEKDDASNTQFTLIVSVYENNEDNVIASYVRMNVHSGFYYFEEVSKSILEDGHYGFSVEVIDEMTQSHTTSDIIWTDYKAPDNPYQIPILIDTKISTSVSGNGFTFKPEVEEDDDNHLTFQIEIENQNNDIYTYFYDYYVDLYGDNEKIGAFLFKEYSNFPEGRVRYRIRRIPTYHGLYRAGEWTAWQEDFWVIPTEEVQFGKQSITVGVEKYISLTGNRATTPREENRSLPEWLDMDTLVYLGAQATPYDSNDIKAFYFTSDNPDIVEIVKYANNQYGYAKKEGTAKVNIVVETTDGRSEQSSAKVIVSADDTKLTPIGARSTDWDYESGNPTFTTRDGEGYKYTFELYRDKDNKLLYSESRDLYEFNKDVKVIFYNADMHKCIDEDGEYYYVITTENTTTGEKVSDRCWRRELSANKGALPTPEIIENDRTVSIEGADSRADGYEIEVMYSTGFSTVESFRLEAGTYIYTLPSEEDFKYRVRAAGCLETGYYSGDYTAWQTEYWDNQAIHQYLESFSFNTDGKGYLDYKLADGAKGKKISFTLYYQGTRISGVGVDGSDNNNRAPFAAGLDQSGQYSIGITIWDDSYNPIFSDREMLLYEYTRPSDSQMDAPKNLRWNGTKATFDNVPDAFAYKFELLKDDKVYETFEFGEFGKRIENDFGTYINQYPDSKWTFRVYAIAQNNLETAMSDYAESQALGETISAITIIPLPGGSKVLKGYSGKLSCAIESVDAPLSDINWTSSDPAISIKGMPGTKQASFIAASAGDSVITASVGNISDSYTISVVDKINVHYADDITPDGTIPAIYGEPLKSIGNLIILGHEGEIFAGWYTQPDGKGQRVTENTLAKDQFDIYAYWEDATHAMRVRPIEDGNYTGSAIKPMVEVYDGQSGKILEEKKDYTVSYKNNTNAWVKGSKVYQQDTDINGNYVKAPTVIVTGKGNYGGKEIVTFNIYPADINGDDFTADDLAVAYKENKVQQAKPVIKRGSKTLGKKDYEVEYKNSEAEGAFMAPGVYEIELTGKGNYTGTRTIHQRITKSTLISKASVKLEKNQNPGYTGLPVEPTFTVKSGSTELRDGTDYSIAFENNIEVGTATAIITGKGDYVGMKRVTFKITGERIDKANVSVIEDQIYTGFDIKPKVSLSTRDGEAISENDYEVRYAGNIKPGKATITIIGKNQYKGTSKKLNFRILACPMDSEEMYVSVSSNHAEYSKTGARPSGLTVMHLGKYLEEGKDYTVVCKNNNKLTDDATLVVKGKGRYKGESEIFHYSVVKRSLVLSGNRVIKMSVPDKVAQPDKAGVYKSTPTLTDNGKKLGGSDYDARNIKYYYSLDSGASIDVGKRSVKNGDEVADTDIIPAGAFIKTVVPAKEESNYTGEAVGYYRVVKQDISKATVGKITRYYTGEKIEFTNTEDFEDWNVTLNRGTESLKYGVDYYVVPESYAKNVNKGTAKVTIRGMGNYGGTKVVSFTIAARSVERKKLKALSIDKSYISKRLGDTDKLNVSYLPSDAYVPSNSVKWSSSNNDIVTVDDEGNIECKGIGFATIEATVNGHVATCMVEVTADGVSTFIDVTEYGAVPNDAEDDTSAINQAIRDASNNRKGPKKVYIPSGEYCISISDDHGVDFNSTNGVYLKMDPNAVLKVGSRDKQNNMHGIICLDRATGIIIEGGQLDGGYTGSNANEEEFGIMIARSSNIEIRDMVIRNLRGDGIYMGKYNEPQWQNGNINIIGCTVEGCARNNIGLTNADNVTIEDCVIQNGRGYNLAGYGMISGLGLDIEPNSGQVVSNVHVNNCTFKNNRDDFGIHCHNGKKDCYMSKDITFDGCSFYSRIRMGCGRNVKFINTKHKPTYYYYAITDSETFPD